MIFSSLSPALGPMLTASLLLGVAAVAKLRRPVPAGLALAQAGSPVSADPVVRGLAVAEVAIAVIAIVGGGLWVIPLVVAYGAFAGFTALEIRRGAGLGETPDCGCFGDVAAPVSRFHVGANLVLAAGALWAAVARVDGLATSLDDNAFQWLVVAGLSAVAVAGIRALLTEGAAVNEALRQGAS